MGMDLSIYRFGAVWSRIPTAQWLVTPSRALLETTVRQRVRKLPGVEVCEDTSVSGLVGAAGPGTRGRPAGRGAGRGGPLGGRPRRGRPGHPRAAGPGF